MESTIIGSVIERIHSLYSKGVRTDETSLASRHIYAKISSVKSRLIILQANKKQKLNEWNYTHLPCIEMIEVPSHECSCFMDLGCTIYRSKYPIPKILTTINGELIDYVSNIDVSKIYSKTTRRESLVKKGNRYTKFDFKYVLENGYIYILDSQAPKVLRLKAIFEDQVAAISFPSACNSGDCIDCGCKDPQQEILAIDPELIEVLIEACVGELIDKFSQGRRDEQNNSKEEN